MKAILPLTYKPKIQAVIDGKCKQIIRAGRIIYSEIAFHGWEGKPYHSKWSFRTEYFQVILQEPIIIYPHGIFWSWAGITREWADPVLDDVAWFDGINPPTGTELKKVLCKMHKIPPEGIEAQIIRWD